MATDAQWLAASVECIRKAAAQGRKLRIRGGGSKDFYGNAQENEAHGIDVLETAGCLGVIDYQPRELTLTACAGTPLEEIERLLAAHGQMLPFEPPHFAAVATLGGCVASGLSGPRRPYAGAVRDAVLGATVLDGRAQVLRFGGRVIKNVAGYDVSRLLAGSLGTLGMLLEISLKVLPSPESECTLMMPSSAEDALATMNQWAAGPLPLSATAWRAGQLYVRLSGAGSAVEAAARKIGGERVVDAPAFWTALREQALPEFAARSLWRCSVPSAAEMWAKPAPLVIEWGGGVRWYRGDLQAIDWAALAAQRGGHATLFRSEVPVRRAFAPLAPAMAELHRRIRHVLDPHGVFDTGRM